MTDLARLLAKSQFGNSKRKALIGLDGFVDTIIRPVDSRTDKDTYTLIPTLKDFGERIASASGMSLNIEMIRSVQKMGGNGISMAYALGRLGTDTTCLGAMGKGEIHPAFRPMQESVKLYSFAEPALTSAVEFEDGKIISSQLESLNRLDWETIVRAVGFEKLKKMFLEADLIALNNWTMIPQMDDIWEHILGEILDGSGKPDRYFIFDPADPQKRTPEDVRQAIQRIRRFTEFGTVIMSCNVREAKAYAGILGIHEAEDPDGSYGEQAQLLSRQIGIDGFVIHTLKDAFLGTAERIYEAEGDYTPHPVLTTGGGDNFNGGFAYGLLSGFDYENALRLGSRVSGFYVRNGHSPSRGELREYIE